MPAGAWARTGLVGAVARGRVGVLGCALVAGGRVVLRSDDGHGVFPSWVAPARIASARAALTLVSGCLASAYGPGSSVVGSAAASKTTGRHYQHWPLDT